MMNIKSTFFRIAAGTGALTISLVPILAPLDVLLLLSLLLIPTASIFFRTKVNFRFVDYLCSLVASVPMVLVVISRFSGFSGNQIFNSFNLYCLPMAFVIIGICWFAGLAIVRRDPPAKG